MSKEEFLNLTPMPRKSYEKMDNVSCPYLSCHEMEHTVHINPSELYLCIDSNLVSILAQLKGEQLKEIFQLLAEGNIEDISTGIKKTKDPMVKTILNIIDAKGRQYGRFILDYVGSII